MKKTLYVLTCALCALLVLPAAAQVPSYVPTDGLVGWWPFNGNANDESGNGNDGLVNGATLTEDRFGNAGAAYNFNGINNFIDLGSSPSLNSLDTNFSISAWVKDFSTTDTSNIISCHTPGFNWRYIVSTRGDSVACGFTRQDNGNWAPISTASGSILQNEWTNIVVVRNNTLFHIFIDGVMLSTVVVPLTPMDGYSVNAITKIGINFPSAPDYNYFDGSLDDIAIYNRALTEQEIQNLYTGQCPTVSANCTSLPSNLQQGLVGYWPFCGNANDESGNGNDGVVNGATLTEDRFGNANAAYGFDGNTSFINCGSSSLLESSELTISAWYACSAFNTQWAENCLLSNYTNQGFMLVLSEGTQPQIRITTTEGNKEITAAPPTLNVWYHLLSVITPEYLKLYINNNLVDSIEMGDAIFTSNDTLVIGRASWFENTSYYSGLLDDIGIWNRALTPEEVQELYTLDACTFTVYDTVMVENVIDVFDTTTVVETVVVFDTLTVENVIDVFDTITVVENVVVFDTLTVENVIDVYDTTYVTVTDTLIIDIPSGVGGTILNTLLLYPNPTSDQLTINYGNFAAMAGYSLSIFDSGGSAVHETNITQGQETLDISQWSAGVYQVVVYNASGIPVETRQIVRL